MARSGRHAIALGAGIAVVVLGSTLAPTPAHAAGGDFGLGLIIGSPTGIAGKYYLKQAHAIDFAVGGTLVGSRGLGVHADYLWHPVVLAREAAFDLALYAGVGARLIDHQRRNRDDDFHVGARLPVGVDFDFLKGSIPLDVFVEVAMVLDFVIDDDEYDDHDDLDVDLNAGLGARYFF